jgi:hypothetical protein
VSSASSVARHAPAWIVDQSPLRTCFWSLVAGLLTFPLAGEATAAKRSDPRKKSGRTFNECPASLRGCDEDDGVGKAPRSQLLLQFEPGQLLHPDIQEGLGRAALGFGI